MGLKDYQHRVKKKKERKKERKKKPTEETHILTSRAKTQSCSGFKHSQVALWRFLEPVKPLKKIGNQIKRIKKRHLGVLEATRAQDSASCRVLSIQRVA